jgi:zona occludens toxin
MPIKIHHGAPGTYKTSGAIGDDFLREAMEGRTIITNVRGVSRDRCFDVFPDLPTKFDLIWIDDRDDDGRDKLRKWFHWAPKGAFFFIDEVQDIWPRRWRDSDLRELDYPGGLSKAKEDDRPKDWEQAWDKHRHWNWDFVLTTPDIKKVRDDIRGIADGAYKHKDLALIGFKGRYIEGFHSPESAGTAESHFYSINKKKVPAYVWKLYDSTATGVFTFTKSGLSLFKNPRVLFLLAILGFSGAYALRNGGTVDMFKGVGEKPVEAAKTTRPRSEVRPVPSDGRPGRRVVVQQDGRAALDAVAYVEARKPRIDGLPHTAPVYDKLTEPKQVPEPVGCMESRRTGCQCYTQQGTPYRTTQELCRQILAHGLWMDWKLADKDAVVEEKAPKAEQPEKEPFAGFIQRGDQVASVEPQPVVQGNDSTNPKYNPAMRGK